MNAIEFNEVNYQTNSFSLDLQLNINKGDIVTIIGPSGSGKSTILNLIAGFLTPKSGDIFLFDQKVNSVPPNKRNVSILFQENNLFTHLTVFQNLALGVTPNLKVDKLKSDKIYSIAKKLDIFELLPRYPDSLSGGQKQRVAIGRCLLQNRSILLLDEPFSALDPELKSSLLMLIYQLQSEYEFTLVTVTHQYEDILPSHRCIKLALGTIIYDGPYHEIK